LLFLLVEEAERQQSAARLQSAFLILRSDMQIALEHELLFCFFKGKIKLQIFERKF
jgi:hypothetical protein